MENSNYILKYKEKVSQSHILIDPKNWRLISYNSFKHHNQLKESISSLGSMALLQFSKEFSSNHILTEASIISYTNAFTTDIENYKEFKIHPFSIIKDEDENFYENSDLPESLLKQISKFTDVQFHSIDVFTNAIESRNNNSQLVNIDTTMHKQRTHSILKKYSKALSGVVIKWIDAYATCDYLNISKACLQKYREQNLISYSKFNGKILYDFYDMKRRLVENYHEAAI